MLKRQQIILKIIESAGKSISRLQLVKLSFLFANEIILGKPDSFYQFVPYKYGPFSFGLYHEIEKLINQGLIAKINEQDLKLGEAINLSVLKLEPVLDKAINYICQKYGGLSNTELLNTVYNRYPWFTLCSVKIESRRFPPVEAKIAIYTAGYENLQVDGFLNILLKAGIKKIIDVRYNPVARRFGFHKTTLNRLANNLNIKYVHLPEVGIPSDWRCNLNRLSDYERLFNRYEQEIINEEKVKKIAELITEEPSVLVCKEANPRYCHRTRLAKHINNLTGLNIIDLGE
ncbi:MAG: DUF488 domain-containing protein [Firmicutes bacterium]|nr:DUF488 domain-containing protein [Bacillota bacterium]